MTTIEEFVNDLNNSKLFNGIFDSEYDWNFDFYRIIFHINGKVISMCVKSKIWEEENETTKASLITIFAIENEDMTKRRYR